MNYVVLFRGINVGGKNVVKMTDLEALLFDLGLNEVKTYIQSGNAVCKTVSSETDLLNKIRDGFIDRFGFESSILVRSIEEIRILVEQLPIPAAEIAAAERADPQIEHLYVYFLAKPPEQMQIDAVCKEYVGADVLQIGKREIYLLCQQSIRKSKLAARASKIFDSATVRNWKTVSALYDMMITL